MKSKNLMRNFPSVLRSAITISGLKSGSLVSWKTTLKRFENFQRTVNTHLINTESCMETTNFCVTIILPNENVLALLGSYLVTHANIRHHLEIRKEKLVQRSVTEGLSSRECTEDQSLMTLPNWSPNLLGNHRARLGIDAVIICNLIKIGSIQQRTTIYAINCLAQ